MPATLSVRALNRATLARQMLLRRERISVRAALERLIALQAQLMRPTVLALAARVDGFRGATVTEMIERRELVRATMMRGTLHLTTAEDFLAFRPVLQPMLTKAMQALLRDRVAVLDRKQVAKAFAKPRSFDSFRDELLEKDPQCDARAIAYAVRMQFPLVEVAGRSEFVDAERWLGQPLANATTPHALVLRYLAAFGPATPADFQSWSGMQSMRSTFEELRPQLVTFRDERKRELFDLPDAPRPDEATPAPVRFLPDFDVLLLGHADRSRVIADEHEPKMATKNLRVLPVFLIDGFAAGTWSATKGRIAIEPFRKLTKREREGLDVELAGLRTED